MPRVAKIRAGFTIVEVVVALTILMMVMLALITMTGRTMRVSVTSDREQAAIQLVTDRTDLIRSDPDYGGLDTLYAGTETGFTGLTDYTRTTTIVHTDTLGLDFKRVTVTVDGPGLPNPVSRTITVASP